MSHVRGSLAMMGLGLLLFVGGACGVGDEEGTSRQATSNGQGSDNGSTTGENNATTGQGSSTSGDECACTCYAENGPSTPTDSEQGCPDGHAISCTCPDPGTGSTDPSCVNGACCPDGQAIANDGTCVPSAPDCNGGACSSDGDCSNSECPADASSCTSNSECPADDSSCPDNSECPAGDSSCTDNSECPAGDCGPSCTNCADGICW